MSGIEVIGIVLGILPILIKAVEGYEKGLGPLGVLFWPSKYRLELRRLDRQLRTQRDLFESSLKVLLSPVIDETTFSKVLVGANETSWSPATKAMLEGVLSAGCLIVIEDMGNTVKQLQIVLQGPKLKFSFTQQKRDGLVNDLRRYNSDLQGFASHRIGRDSVLPMRERAVQEPRLRQDRLRRVRLIASDLYTAIEQSSQSQTRSCHVVNLYIEIQDTVEEYLQCRLLLAQMLSSPSRDSLPQWSMREVIAKVEDREMSQPVKQEMQSQCTTLEGLIEAKADSRLFIEGLIHRFQVQAVGQPKYSDMKAQNIYHLSHLLDKSDILATELARRWYRWQRSQIAVTLAYTVLQLYKSPWLEFTWSSGDIQIMGDASNQSYEASWYPSISRPFPSIPDNLEPSQPFAGQSSKESIIAAESMSLIPISTQRKSSASRKQGGPRVRNRDLYNLGIVLVELAFNTTLRQKREKSDYDDPHAPGADVWTDHNTACRLLENELVWEMGPAYASVVRRCIYGFDIDTHDFENPRFHNMVCTGVLEPLKKDLMLRGPSGRSFPLIRQTE